MTALIVGCWALGGYVVLLVHADLCIFTGSYDHTVKMFDTRIGESSIMTVEHGAPVESVLMFPTGGVFISAGRLV